MTMSRRDCKIVELSPLRQRNMDTQISHVTRKNCLSDSTKPGLYSERSLLLSKVDILKIDTQRKSNFERRTCKIGFTFEAAFSLKFDNCFLYSYIHLKFE